MAAAGGGGAGVGRESEEALRARYAAGGQAHVFELVDAPAVGVSAAEREALLEQLRGIDVTLVNELYTATMASVAPGGGGGDEEAPIEPPSGVVKLAGLPAEEVARLRRAGLEAIAGGKVGALILAGGQGTRLGFDRPKGEYDIGLPSHKCLFQLQVQRVLKLRSLAAAAVGAAADAPLPSLPLYVMTSPMTDADTRAYFAAAGNWGLPASDVVFFSQGTLPCLTPAGKIMLETASHVAEAPDGNGGIYRALHTRGVVADMTARGLVGVHVFAVDNAIVKAADPTFFGFCLDRGADLGSKVCAKAGPHEKVGVVVARRTSTGVSVVEYSEMSKAEAEAVDPATGDLAFNTGNLCIHYYSTAFLATACAPAALPKVYHLAHKAIPFADPATGRTLSKEAMAGRGTTGIKLESFIFDVFPAATAPAILEVPRASEFTPVKNAPGSRDDSPDTARAALSAEHRRWLTAAGATLTGDGAVEVSPLVSYDGEGLAPLVAGHTYATPLYLAAAGEPPAPAGITTLYL